MTKGGPKILSSPVSRALGTHRDEVLSLVDGVADHLHVAHVEAARDEPGVGGLGRLRGVTAALGGREGRVVSQGQVALMGHWADCRRLWNASGQRQE